MGFDVGSIRLSTQLHEYISLIVIHANAYSHDDRYTSALGPPLFNPGRCSPFLQASRVTCTEIRQNSRADRGNVTAFTLAVGIADRRFVIHRFAFDFCTVRRPGSLDVSIDARERERERVPRWNPIPAARGCMRML